MRPSRSLGKAEPPACSPHREGVLEEFLWPPSVLQALLPPPAWPVRALGRVLMQVGFSDQLILIRTGA
jgi:hypothetical protein